MRKIGWTATLAAAALLIASCRPTGPEASKNVPPNQSGIGADAPGDASVSPQPAQRPPSASADRAGQADQPAEHPSDAQAPKRAAPTSSEGRVLHAIGKALIKSISGEAEKEP